MIELPERYHFDGHAVAWGAVGEGAPMVLVHGTPFSSQVWHRILPWIAQNHRIYVFDLLGYGSSDKGVGSNVSLEVQGRLLKALFQYWALEEPFVVAHDFGGATALRGWILHDLRYRALMLIDPVILAPWGSPFVNHVRKHEPAFAGLPAYAHEALLASYIRGAMSREISADELDRYLSPWTSEVGKAAFYAQIAQMDACYTSEIEPRLSQVNCPTTIIWGENDQWVPPEQGRQLAEVLPNAKFVSVPGAGHLVQEDAPEAIVAAIYGMDDPASLNLSLGGRS